MDIIAVLWDRMRALEKTCRRRIRPRSQVPGVTPLEGRTLQTVNASLGFVKAVPTVLAPTGQYVTVNVRGIIGSDQTKPPSGFFFVTDEYRTVEPSGPVTLTPAGEKVVPSRTWHLYSYSFPLKLQAKRSTRTFDGRHYDLFVGATDFAGTDGLTTQVFVPKVYHPPGPTVASTPKTRGS